MKCPTLDPKAHETLEHLGRFWSFSRKKLTAELQDYLGLMQADVTALHQQFIQQLELSRQQALDLGLLGEQSKQQQEQIAGLEVLLAQHKERLAELIRRYRDEQTKARESGERYDQLQASHGQLQERLATVMQRVGELESLIGSQRNELESSRQSLALLQEATDQLESAHAGLQGSLEAMESQHLTLRQKFDLVRSVLALEAPKNAGLDSFAQLISNDYLSFASRESSLADEAGALLALQAVQRELELIVDFPDIRGRTMLAIAGGFSSGKSRFINSFIKGGGVSLAVGMNPVTVIPNYVVCSRETKIRGYCVNGGSFELAEKLYSSLEHEYLGTFGFDLRGIMPFISVQVPMADELFEHICLIDTPGYNPGGGQAMGADRSVAESYAGQASAMIWVIGLDPAGTITQSDLEFIEKTNLSGDSLYILLNKADTKSSDAIADIIDQVELDLQSYGFEFSGICAYSSRKGEVHSWRGESLEEFLRRQNRRRDVLGEIEHKIDDVFDRYKYAIEQDISVCCERRKDFERFKLDALESGGSELYRRMSELCAPLEVGLDVTGLQKHARECEGLRKLFKEAARSTLMEMLCSGSPRTQAEDELVI